MVYDQAPGAGWADPHAVGSKGTSPFATATRTATGKIALGLSLVPFAVVGLMFVLQPG